MNYISTRAKRSVSASEAIVGGISPEGGLYVPESFPNIDFARIAAMAGMNYQQVACEIMGEYLSEFSKDEISDMVNAAYKKFDSDKVVPLTKLSANEYVMELWHGPTLAFKDMALQILPYLMKASMKKTGEKNRIFILVATSGDTGKAALEGFKDVADTKVMVFYPHGGVSEAQRLQMVTQEGGNVVVCAVNGNFDDAQTGVKRIFADPDMAEKLAAKGYKLSSANSINFGRLLPQVVYYFWAYAQLIAQGRIKVGDKINFCVPTGNFGNILAAYYAYRMGLPINKLICASNENNVLTDFFHTGIYDANRKLKLSMSCSIDILVSSNLERLLFEMSGRDACAAEWMRQLKSGGKYDVGSNAIAKVRDLFYADCCTEDDTNAYMKRIFERNGYVMDPHTAVAQCVYERYVEDTGDETVTLLDSTASPFKFPAHVLAAIKPGSDKRDEFLCAEALGKLANLSVPDAIAQLRSKPERFQQVCDIQDMSSQVLTQV